MIKKKKKKFTACLLQLSQNLQALSTFLPACYTLMWSHDKFCVSSSTSLSATVTMRYFSCTFPPVLSFLVIVLHLGKCWGLPHPCPYCWYLLWEYWVHGCRVQAFLAFQVVKPRGVGVCCVLWWNVIASSLWHSGSYLITWTPKVWGAYFSMTQLWCSSCNTYLLNTYYMLDTLIGIGAIMASKCRYNSSCYV